MGLLGGILLCLWASVALATSVVNEHGRRCRLESGRLVPDGSLWRLEGAAPDGAPFCRNGMRFQISPLGEFSRVDDGFEEIFKYYAAAACHFKEEKQLQQVADCFLKDNLWTSLRDALRGDGIPKQEVCTTKLGVECSDRFKRLGLAAVFNDMIVLKEGPAHIRGGGSESEDYIVHPDFKSEIDLRGHSQVFHLPGQKCNAPDVFGGCIEVGAP